MIAALLLLAQGPIADAPPFELPVVPDPVLADQRGGVRLPSGIDLALSVQTQTAVDGAIVLRTVFSVDEGPARTTIYTPRDGQTVSAPATRPVDRQDVAMPTVTFDSRNGVQFTPGATTLPVSIGNRAVAAASAAVPDGLQVIDAAAPVQTANGTVTEAGKGDLRTVILTGRDLEIAHFSGSAFGSAIANSASNREISTDTSISIDLRNAGPDVIGSAMLRVEDVALGAVGSRL